MGRAQGRATRRGRWLASLMTIGIAHPALAQERVPAATGSSDRAAFQQQGFPLDGFRLYPSVRVTTSYDDNVLVRDSDRRGDVVFTLSPDVRVQSQWSNHALNLDAFGRFNRYGRRGALNNDEYGTGTSGRLDVSRTFKIGGSANYAHLFEQRGTPGDLVAINRFIAYDQSQLALNASKQLNRISVGGGVQVGALRYDPSTGNGNLIDQRFRNRDSSGVNGRVAYQYSAVTSFFVSGGVNRVRYTNAQLAGFDRGSNGYSVLAGATFEITRLLSGEIGAGYISQSFRDARFTDFSGLNYNIRLRYEPTLLTSLTFTADRQLTDSALPQVAGVLASRFALGVDHELLRNLVLQANGGYTRYTYRGLSRSDDRWTAGLGARYKLSRYLSTVASYDRVSQSLSGAFGRNFSSNRFSLSLVAAR